MRLLIHWLLSALAIMVASYLLPGIVVQSFFVALVVAVVLGFLNAIIRPILVILTLPITILTLGIFVLVINAFLVLLVSAVVPGFHVDGFWWALAFSILLSIVSAFLHLLEPKKENGED